MIPSFGSLGKKGAFTSMTGKKKSFVNDKYGNIDEDEDQDALHSDYEYDGANGKDRHTSSFTSDRHSMFSEPDLNPPPMRRTHTTALTSARLVKALFDFPGAGADELPLRVGQIVEVKKEVSNDWWTGEFEGRSGLFPSIYVEDYIPIPVMNNNPPLPRRSIPPPRTMHASPSIDLTSDSDESLALPPSADHMSRTSMPSAAPPNAARINKKPAPPPPASRRSASSNNILTAHTAYLPSQPVVRPRANTGSIRQQHHSPTEGSPFAGSDDEDDDHLVGQNIPSPSALRTGLQDIHFQAEATSHGICSCGCDDFTQNVFKAKGMCSTCYHLH